MMDKEADKGEQLKLAGDISDLIRQRLLEALFKSSAGRDLISCRSTEEAKSTNAVPGSECQFPRWELTFTWQIRPRVLSFARSTLLA